MLTLSSMRGQTPGPIDGGPIDGPGPGQRRCAVLGDPIAHSLSPALHRAAYDALGLDWAYDARRVPAGGLADLLGELRADPTWRGLSLTMPLKREAVPLAVDASPTARLAGAGNTLVRDPAGWHAENTDVPGAAAALAERAGGDVAPETVSVLGGGATATSTALALVGAGARHVRLLVRSAARSAETVAAVSAHPAGPLVEVLDLATARVTGDVLVSTVPAEAQDAALLDRTAAVPILFEVRYDPWPTPLAAAAVERGQLLVGGLDLLVHQAALQVRLFTGREAPLATLREAGERALATRGA